MCHHATAYGAISSGLLVPQLVLFYPTIDATVVPPPATVHKSVVRTVPHHLRTSYAIYATSSSAPAVSCYRQTSWNCWTDNDGRTRGVDQLNRKFHSTFFQSTQPAQLTPCRVHVHTIIITSSGAKSFSPSNLGLKSISTSVLSYVVVSLHDGWISCVCFIFILASCRFGWYYCSIYLRAWHFTTCLSRRRLSIGLAWLLFMFIYSCGIVPGVVLFYRRILVKNSWTRYK